MSDEQMSEFPALIESIGKVRDRKHAREVER